jgi:serine/threonine-protein kinase
MLEQLREATLGDYEILAELGSGGMATVFLAHDLQLDRRVAIKLMHPALVAGEGMVERFILEARTAAGLSHPNIIPIYAVKVEEDLLFFVMKFVEGRPLDSIITKEAPLPADMVRHIVSQIADALAYAHARGVIHRDIKPANIMISTDGHPVLTDFGIAKVADKQGLTMTGATIGTPTYMSPEQCNALPLTGASDQYSLGVMAFEMLTGKPPFDADSVMTIMYRHVNEPVKPVLDQVKDCPHDLATAIDRMLNKDPADRFPDIAEVSRAISSPTITGENKVRTQLVQFALAGSNRDVLKRVSTPRSPIPSSLVRKPKTKVERQSPASPSRRLTRPVVLAGGGILVLATIALAMTQPWNRTATPDPAGGVASGSDSVVDSSPFIPTVPQASPESVSVREPDTSVSRVPAAAPPPQSERPAQRQPAPTNPAALPQVSAVFISGSTTLTAGGAALLHAEARDGQGRVMTGKTPVWRSSAPEIASVNSAGQVIARSAGRATITAAVDGVSQSVTVTVNPEPVVVRPPPVRESTPAAAEPAGPTEAELKGQIASTIQSYANALESGNISRVRQIYPAMPPAREQQLRQALPAMSELQVRLTVGQIDLAGEYATARVSGNWVFSSAGRRNTLPADNTYSLERRGAGWVITDIR